MTELDRKRLEKVKPELVEKFEILEKAMREEEGDPIKVCGKAVRTAEEQNALYMQSRKKPPTGPWATNADGYRKKSDHQAKKDGFGYAIDVCFQGPKPFDLTHKWEAFGRRAKALGLEWGGDWLRKDRPHIALPGGDV